MNRLIPWVIVVLLSFILGGASSVGVRHWFRQHQAVAASVPTTALVRDSARVAMDTAHARHDTVVRWLAGAPADTLGPILRALARRPPLILRDTLYLSLDTAMAGDTGSPEPCEISLSCQEARRLAARDTSWALVADSLRWEARIQSARGDSLDAQLGACLDDQARTYRRGLLHGAGAGLATCKTIETILDLFF